LRQAKVATWLLLIGIASGCAIGAPSTFTLDSASVDQSYVCPAAANDLPYKVHATIGVRNGTSSSVRIESVEVVMTLAAVKGGWLEHVGDKYDAAGVMVSPDSVGAGNTASLAVTIPSTCTNGKVPSSGRGLLRRVHSRHVWGHPQDRQLEPAPHHGRLEEVGISVTWCCISVLLLRRLGREAWRFKPR
jgi:hypothetical protein